MRIQRKITQFVALSLAILLGVGNTPVSAAEVAVPATIGSVSAVGSVQLRGVGVTEGTLFSGDSLNVAKGAYAKVVLSTGSKVEVDGNSNVKVSKEADGINIQMTSGNVGFSGSAKPVLIQVGSFVVIPNSQARGSVAFVGTETFGVRVLEGSVTVRDTATKQSSTVTKGTERLISLRGSNPAGVQLASAVPSAIPAVPTMPAPPQLSGGAKKALVIASVLGAAAGIAVLMTKNDDSDADAAARLRAATAAQTAENVEATATAATSAATQITAAATAADAAIAAATTNANFTAAEQAALRARATQLTSQANASQQSLNSLKLNLQNLQSLLDFSNPSNVTEIEAQIQTVLANVNAEVNKLNSLISQLNSLVNDAQNEGIANVQLPNIQPVTPATAASQSQV
jgi:hypothetical protein